MINVITKKVLVALLILFTSFMFVGCLEEERKLEISNIKNSIDTIKSPNMRPLMYECYTDVCFIDFKWLDMKTDTEKVSRFYLFNMKEKHKLHDIVYENGNYSFNVYFRRIGGKSVILMVEQIYKNSDYSYYYLFK